MTKDSRVGYYKNKRSGKHWLAYEFFNTIDMKTGEKIEMTHLMSGKSFKYITVKNLNERYERLSGI